MNIIIVDDEIEALHTFLDELLLESKLSLTYQFFKNDMNAILSYIKKEKVDGAFLDINMNNFTGVELAEKILEISPKTKIVFVTGFNFNLEQVEERIKKNVLGVIEKPVDIIKLERYLYQLANQTKTMKVEVFPTFDCYINNRLIVFSSQKSKELFAYLFVRHGKSVTMEEVITILWPDKPLEKSKILYRDAVWRLRQTLKENEFECVTFSRALLVLDSTNIMSEYYDIITGKKKYKGQAFLISYEWSIYFESALKDKYS